MTTTYRFRLRGDIAADWAADNPVLLLDEPGIESDTGQLKFGEGVTPWNDLGYTGGSVPDASGVTKGKVALAGDLGGTADAPTVPGLVDKADDDEVVKLAGNQTIAGLKTLSTAPQITQSGGARVVRETRTPRQFGGAMDGTTDDSVAVQAMFDAIGDHTTGFHGVEMVIDGPCMINNTVAMRRKSPRLVMPGWGSSTSTPKGSYLKSGPAMTGLPMLVIQEMWGGEIEGLRFIGSSTNKPSAAIYLNRLDGHNSNTFSAFRRIWIGGLYGYDSDDAEQFTTGILLDGFNANNDLMLWQLINIHKAGTGIRFGQSQMGYHWLQNFTTEQCGIGIDTTADISGANVHCLSSSSYDLRLGNGAGVDFLSFVSEGSAALADMQTVDGNKRLTLRGGYWQPGPNIRGDGEVIRGTHLYSLEVALEDFKMEPVTDYAGPTPKIVLKSVSGASKKYLRLINPSFIAAANIDMTTQIAGDVRVVRIERSGTNGNYVATQNIYGYPDNLDEARFDLIGTTFRLVDDQAAANMAALNKVRFERGPTMGANVNAGIGTLDWVTGPAKYNVARITGAVGPDWVDSGNLVFYTKESGAALAEMMRIHNTAGSDQTGMSLITNNGGSVSVRRVVVGAADSAGSGFRTLRVAN